MASDQFPRPPLASPGGVNQNLIQKFKNFNIEPVQYPSDLGGEDLKHWVQFTINVRGKSFLSIKEGGLNTRLGNEKALDVVLRDSNSSNLTNEQLSRASDLLLPGAIGGAVAGGTYAKLSNRAKSTGGSVTGAVTGAVVTGVGAAVATYVFKQFEKNLKPDTTFKISDAIALYVDGPPTVRYAAQYSNKDLGIIAGLAGGGGDAIFSSEALAGAAAQFAKLPGALGVNVPDVVSAAAKVSLNPFKEVIFEAVDFRAFNFKYRFFPKSKQEAENVEKIIRLFKFHMHPDLSSNKLFFIYPSEFEIAYFFENKENTYFHKIKPCVLESMDISYGGEQFSSFKDGIPTEVNMTLTFRETEILTKRQIKDGY